MTARERFGYGVALPSFVLALLSGYSLLTQWQASDTARPIARVETTEEPEVMLGSAPKAEPVTPPVVEEVPLVGICTAGQVPLPDAMSLTGNGVVLLMGTTVTGGREVMTLQKSSPETVEKLLAAWEADPRFTRVELFLHYPGQ